MNRHLLRAVAAATVLVLASACASSTVIRSTPSGAKLYLNEELAGQTPYTMTDTKIIGTITNLRLKADGYQEFQTSLSRTEEFQVGPCIGGAFVLVPWLWIMGYKPEHHYELTPIQPPLAPPPAPRS